MRLFAVLLLLCAASFAQTVTNPTTPTGSGCVSAGVPAGCTSGYSAITTKPSNAGAITVITDPVPGNINISDVHALLPAGMPTPVFFHYVDWWGCPGHISIGKVGNNPAAIANEAAVMRAAGGAGAGMIIDWAGNLDASKSCRLTNTNAWAAYLTANFATAPLRMAINIDQASFQGICPTGATNQTTCITTALKSLFDYINANYASQPWYLKDGGQNVVHFFIDEASWTGTNWTTVWSDVKAYTNAFATPFKYVFENTFTHTQSNGGFAWLGNPITYSISSQLFWGSNTSTTPTSYNTFYASCGAHPSDGCWGVVKKGFDDGIGFGGGFTGLNRVQSQRCGQTWLDTFNLIAADGFSSSNPLDYLQVVTFNDYEEGTPLEMGIDNCFLMSSTFNAGRLNWVLTPTDATYSSTSTIDHLRLVACPASCSVITDNIPVALSGSTSTLGLAANTLVFMQAVGKSMIRNVASPGIPIPPPTAPAPSLYAVAH